MKSIVEMCFEKVKYECLPKRKLKEIWIKGCTTDRQRYTSLHKLCHNTVRKDVLKNKNIYILIFKSNFDLK